jgi:hypothetical protein
MNDSRLLKLVTGVDTSTRPVSKSGREGNKSRSKSRRARAPPNTAAFLRSTGMLTSTGRQGKAMQRKNGPLDEAAQCVEQVDRLLHLAVNCSHVPSLRGLRCTGHPSFSQRKKSSNFWEVETVFLPISHPFHHNLLQSWRKSRRRVSVIMEPYEASHYYSHLTGTSGQAKNYITRTQAVRKLQISLPDFRRLCIFKGSSFPPLV